jgi:hypothetical protein
MSEDYELDTTATFEAITEAVTGELYSRDIDPPHYYQGTYGVGIWEGASGGTDYRFSGCLRSTGLTPDNIITRQDFNVTLQMTAFYLPGSSSLLYCMAGMACVHDDVTYMLVVSISGAGSLSILLFDTDGTVHTTFKSGVDVSGWTLASWLSLRNYDKPTYVD